MKAPDTTLDGRFSDEGPNARRNRPEGRSKLGRAGVSDPSSMASDRTADGAPDRALTGRGGPRCRSSGVPPGTAFPGVIGRTDRRVEPGVAAAGPAGPGAPTCCSSCWTTPGSGSSAVTAARSRRRTSTRSPPAGCATTTCTPRRCARRAGRASSPAATTTPTAWRRSPSWPPAIPGYNGVIPFENGFLSEMLLEHGYNTYMVGKWHLTPSNQETAAGPVRPLAAGARLRALLRLPRRRHQPVVSRPGLRQPPGRAAATPEEGYHLTEDLADKAIAVHRRRQAGRPGQAVLPALLLRRHARPAPRRRRSGPTGTPGSSTTAGTPTASRCSPARRSWASFPPTPSCPGTTRTCPTGTRCPTDARRLSSRMMEVFAGFLTHTDHQIGRLLDFLRELGELDNTLIMVISDNGASAEGGPTGTTNETQFFNNAPGAARGQPRRHRRDRRPDAPSTTTRGAGRGPATRRSGGGSGRPTAAASCDPFLVTGRRASRPAARSATQYAHIIDMVPTVLDVLGIEPPATIRGVTQAPLHGVSFAHTFDDADAPSRPPHAVLRDVRPPGDLPRRLAGGLPVARALVRRGRRRVRSARSRPRQLVRARRERWELYHVAEDFAENHDVAAENRDKLIALIGTWYVEAGKYGVLPIDGSGLAADDRREAAARRSRGQLHLLPGHPVGPVLRRRRGCSTARTASPPTSRSRTAAPRACCSAREPAPAASRST